MATKYSLIPNPETKRGMELIALHNLISNIDWVGTRTDLEHDTNIAVVNMFWWKLRNTNSVKKPTNARPDLSLKDGWEVAKKKLKDYMDANPEITSEDLEIVARPDHPGRQDDDDLPAAEDFLRMMDPHANARGLDRDNDGYLLPEHEQRDASFFDNAKVEQYEPANHEPRSSPEQPEDYASDPAGNSSDSLTGEGEDE